MRFLVGVVSLLVLASLAVQVSCKHGCSKDWLRQQVVNSCGMDKRHLYRRRPSLAPSMEEILNEVDEEFENWWNTQGELDIIDKRKPTTTPKSTWNVKPTATESKDKKHTNPPEGTKNLFIRLFEHPLELFAQAWLGLTGGEVKKHSRRNAVFNMIDVCCKEGCSEDAFEGVCD